MEDLSGRQLGTYKVLAPLGQGGMAAVYLALQISVNRQVALKVLPRHFAGDAEFVARFRREVSILAMLKHPGILSIIDFGESDGYTYIVMPLVEGGTLASRLTGDPLRLEEAARIIGQIGDALDYAHGKGVVHRDLKPSNILMDERGNCLLSDFGIARISGGGGHLTMTGTQIGTPTYMSPEQAEGQPGGPASDIYSLGVVLYELVSGRVPFEADTPIAIAVKHVMAQVPPPRSHNPHLPAAVEAVVLKALARAPGDRYATVHDLTAALSLAAMTSPRAAPQQAASAASVAAAVAPVPLPPTVLRTPVEPRPALFRQAATPTPTAPPGGDAPAASPTEATVVIAPTVRSSRRDRTPAPAPVKPAPPIVSGAPTEAIPPPAPAPSDAPPIPYWSAGRLIVVMGMLGIPLLFIVLALARSLGG
jgi:serine/threonine-protein kinase